jgi:cytoskeletal protein CcmA (bactofilin family)
MTMFNRNDKMPEGAPTEAPRPQTVQPTTPAPRPQAAPQPIAAATPSSSGVSVISKALKITGQLESTEDIRIDGEVDGDVRAVSVTVGSNAKVKGTVYGETVELAGTVDGKIEAKKVVLTSSARMSGDVIHQDVRIESGAYIDGHLKPEYGKHESRNASPRAVSMTRDSKAGEPARVAN